MADQFTVKFIQNPATTAARLATAAAGDFHVGLKKCITVTVGFIVPCGEVEIGGCWTANRAAVQSVLPTQIASGVTKVVLDPVADAAAIQKALVLKKK